MQRVPRLLKVEAVAGATKPDNMATKAVAGCITAVAGLQETCATKPVSMAVAAVEDLGINQRQAVKIIQFLKYWRLAGAARWKVAAGVGAVERTQVTTGHALRDGRLAALGDVVVGARGAAQPKRALLPVAEAEQMAAEALPVPALAAKFVSASFLK